MALDQKYIQQATNEYNPTYNAKVTALKNQLAQNKLTLDQQKTGINTNYDTQVANQNLANLKSKNNISNTMLGRGLANSSIVTSGLGEADQQNNRLVGQINTARTGALNDIEAQKALAEQNVNNTIGQLEGDKQSAIMALARQLYDSDWTKNYQSEQLAMQKAAQLAQQAYQNRTLAIQQQNAATENAYKLRALALQQAQQDAENKYKYDSLQWDKDKFNSTPNSTIADRLSYLAQINGDDSLTTAQKLAKVGSMANAFDGQKGYEAIANASHSAYGDLLRQQANDNLARNQGTSSSSSGSNFWDLFKMGVGNQLKWW